MSRRPAITALLNGQAVKVGLGSTRVISNPASAWCIARAQAAPPKPPPRMTTRGFPCAIAGVASSATAPLRNVRRVVQSTVPALSAARSAKRQSPGSRRRKSLSLSAPLPSTGARRSERPPSPRRSRPDCGRVWAAPWFLPRQSAGGSPNTMSLPAAAPPLPPPRQRAPAQPPEAPSRPLQVLTPQRQRTDALPGRREDRIAQRRRQGRHRGLAAAAPEPATRHHRGFDDRHAGEAQHLVIVEIALLYSAVLDRDRAVERRREPVDDAALGLRPQDLGIDHMAGVDRRDDAVHSDL